MPHRRIAPALLTAALFMLAGPGLAAAQPMPAASATPEPAPSTSALPSAEPAAPPRAEVTASPQPAAPPDASDDASPSPAPGSKATLSGTLMSIKGTVATVKMANGAVQTYTVSGKTAALLKKTLGKKFAFRVLHGALDLIPH
ncbi:MAG TPA: hypothetical protein VGC96_13625 [Candidatus Elarobacter sp.]|jgi:hypothetical protein